VILGLGGTVGTPPEGITAPVVVVGSYEELEALGRETVEGKIVLYDNPFVRTGEEMKDYGRAVKYRSGGASAAARLGAVAALVRSVATTSLRTPHTGGLRYNEEDPKIPAAAVTVEDSMLLRRLVEAGEDVRVNLFLGARTEPDRDGANVVAEIPGRERPEEIVLIGAHLDSWDVGTGAIDDGAGCIMVIETMRLIASGPPPRRTVRGVLYANEENGLRGGRAYRDAHEAELSQHVAAIESDSGGGRALGLDVTAGEGGVEMLHELLAPVLAPIGAARVRSGGGGADISVLEDHGVPLLGFRPDTTNYFHWHHTMADTLDKIDPGELQHATAAFAAATWVLAESPSTLPRVPPEESEED
jgi:Zn-dependent M28 family amino/carboxypeptidase